MGEGKISVDMEMKRFDMPMAIYKVEFSNCPTQGFLEAYPCWNFPLLVLDRFVWINARKA